MSSPNNNIDGNPTAPPEVLFEDAYNSLLPKFRALSTEELVPINLDIPAAVTTALGVAPELAAFKDEVAQHLPKLDFEPMLHLDEYAMALSHAHTLYLMASQPVDSLQALVAEGTALRETLFVDASALVRRSLLNGNQLKDLQGPVGYKNLAVDLQILAALFRENLGQLQGKCAVQATDVHRAEQIAAEILRTVGLREQGPTSVAATSDMRARAFTAFVRVYDQARRIVTFLRWNEDDVGSIAPSLYAGRSNGRKKPGADSPNGGDAPPAPGPTAPTAPSTGTAAGTGPTAPIQHGHPGAPSAEPFLS